MGLRHEERAIEAIEQRNAGSREERDLQTVVTQQAAERRAQDEADSKGCPQHAEVLSPCFRRADIRDIR
ncbi:hypothetical protein D3C72_2251040 [compost metagenome]